MRLSYAIKYVADMDAAIAFHRDKLVLALAFQSPFWTEFATGETRLALHLATDDHPAGSAQLGFASDDLAAFYAARDANGISFTMPPTEQHGSTLARFMDSEGAETTVSG